jgi:hypothetical protein
MFTHPAITAALAEQHRRDMTARASTYRNARAARTGQPTRPGWPPQPHRITSQARALRRAVTAIAAIAAAAVLGMTPAGATSTPHYSAHHFQVPSQLQRWA